MPQQPKYLSTDPYAGSEAPRYLSTDPHAGDDEPPLTLERPGPAPKTPGPIEMAIATLGYGGALGVPGGEMGELVSRAVQPRNLAASGATVGGILGGVPGAAAGGAAGSALASGMERTQDALVSGRRTGPTFEELVGDVTHATTEGATQGALQAAGGVIAKGAGALLSRAAPLATKAASRINANALKVNPALAAKNPGVDIPLEAAKAGAAISPAGERALSTRIAGLKSQASDAIEQSAAQVRPSDATGPARELLRQRQALGPIAADDVKIIEDEIRAFVGPDVPISATEMQAIKSYLQSRLASRFGAATLPARAEVQQALRAGAREALETSVPGVADANAQMSRLIPVRQAVRDALGRERRSDVLQAAKVGGASVAGLAAGAAAGGPVGAGIGGIATGLATRALESPAVRSRIASNLYRGGQTAAATAPSVRRVLVDAAPAAFRAALLAALNEPSPEPVDAGGRPIRNVGPAVR